MSLEQKRTVKSVLYPVQFSWGFASEEAAFLISSEEYSFMVLSKKLPAASEGDQRCPLTLAPSAARCI